MALYSIPSASTITIRGALCLEISGTATIDSILGVKDGQILCVLATGAWSFSAAGNIVASTVAQVSGTPLFLLCRNQVLTQVGVSGYASTGSGSLVRATSPTIVTPVIASFATAQHSHLDAAGGGQITPAAINGTTGTGNVVRASEPTIDKPVVTNWIQLGSVFIIVGTGTPEGAVAATVGSTFHRDDGGASTSLYIKESGSSVTGWRAV